VGYCSFTGSAIRDKEKREEIGEQGVGIVVTKAQGQGVPGWKSDPAGRKGDKRDWD